MNKKKFSGSLVSARAFHNKPRDYWLEVPYPRELHGPVRTLEGEELERVKAELLSKYSKKR